MNKPQWNSNRISYIVIQEMHLKMSSRNERPFCLGLNVLMHWLVTSLALNAALSWWHHQMETFSALLVICAGNSPVPGEFPTQRPVTRSFDVFFDLRPNKRLSKQWWGWWFETPPCPLWCHCNVVSKRTHTWNRNRNKIISYKNIKSVFIRRPFLFTPLTVQANQMWLRQHMFHSR